MFSRNGKSYRMGILPPDPEDYRKTDGGRGRDINAVKACVEKELKRRARVLLLLVKAKFESCSIGDSSIEKEFLGI